MGQLGWLYFPAQPGITISVTAEIDWMFIQQNPNLSNRYNATLSPALFQLMLNAVGITTACYTLPLADSRIWGDAENGKYHPNDALSDLFTAVGVTATESALTTSLDAPICLPLLQPNALWSSASQLTTAEADAVKALGGIVLMENGIAFSNANSHLSSVLNNPYFVSGNFSGDLSFGGNLLPVPSAAIASSVPSSNTIATMVNSAASANGQAVVFKYNP